MNQDEAQEYTRPYRTASRQMEERATLEDKGTSFQHGVCIAVR